MYVVAYVVASLAVGLIVGYLKGHKQGYGEGYDAYERMHQNALSERGRKAAQTRRMRKDELPPILFRSEVAP